MRVNDVVSIERSGDIAVLIAESPPVNALSHAVRVGLLAGMEELLASPPRAIVLACRGATFFAGADISEFGKPLLPPMLGDIQDAFERSPVPVVAAMHGTALGGGLEIALGCHYRVAVRSAKLGLPEVNLGLLPGAGGTQRVPRLIGVPAALDLIAGGRPVSAVKAADLGLIDAVVEGDDPVAGAFAFLDGILADGRVHPRVRDMQVAGSGQEAQAAADEWRASRPAQFKGFKAPSNILKAVVAAASMSFDDGIAREAELFDELIVSEESAAQRYAFFADRGCAKIPDLPKDAKARNIASTGVIGAGTMGTGIAIALLQSGFEVTLVDKSPEILHRAEKRIVSTLRKAVEKGRAELATVEAQCARLSTADSVASLSSCDLVIEAVFERLELKQAVFAELDSVAKAGAVLATNTSFLDVDAIAGVTGRPGDVVGLHFFAPANLMRLLEVVRGEATSPEVLATAMWLGRKLNKLAVVSGVCDGFIANRVMARRGEAADRLILQGASPAQIDRVMVDYGFPMGPFQMIDLVGLDVIGWDKDTSAGRTVQEFLCEAGDFGQKTGAGYYDYSSGKAVPSDRAQTAIERIRQTSGYAQRTWTDEELLNELLDPTVNEAAKLIEESMVYRVSDIDMALIAGYGWPVYRGGPAFWGDMIGLRNVVTRLERRAGVGKDADVSQLLRQHAAEGRPLVRTN